MTRIAKTFTLLAAATSMAAIGLVGARVDAQAPADAFNFPEDINFLSQQDPNVRKATARVNGNIITGTDVDQRMALIIAANEVEIPPEEMQRLRLQVLRNLIDETLQVQEAAALEMAVTADEVDAAYTRYAVERMGRSPEEMDDYLIGAGSSSRSLKRQIQGELAWDRLLRRNIAPFVNVSAAEVDELFDRLQASRGSTEYRIGEIYLSANPSTREAVIANARQIIDQLRNGGSFLAYARQFSEASSAAVGGDLGWIQLEQLQNPTLEAAARNMQAGQLEGPIEIAGGFSIMLMIDRRQIGMADPRDAILSLKQIALQTPAGLPESEAQLRADQFQAMMATVNGCGDADAKAAELGASVIDNDQVIARSLPEAFQPILLQMNIGQATPVFGVVTEEVRVLMLCGRDDPDEQAGPSFDQLMSQMENERINRRAQSYLRDLRRDAVIDYD